MEKGGLSRPDSRYYLCREGLDSEEKTMTRNTKTTSGFRCMECGHKFRTISSATHASSKGCPKCGGCDVDQPTTYARSCSCGKALPAGTGTITARGDIACGAC